MKRKISSSYPREGKGWVKHPEHFMGGNLGSNTSNTGRSRHISSVVPLLLPYTHLRQRVRLLVYGGDYQGIKRIKYHPMCGRN